MAVFLSHYTPSLMNPEALEAVFVQRQPLLMDLLENIERSVLTEAKHHALLIGPRGIGKTHLMSMIYHRISAKQDLKDKLKIAWLREEEWGVATFLDLLVRILKALIDEYDDPNLAEQVQGLYGISTDLAEQLAGQILRQYCQGKTLLLLMENLDEIFKGLDELGQQAFRAYLQNKKFLDELGQQAFRAYLQNYSFITIVATSQSLFSGVKSRNSPFYGFFSPTHLKPLSLEEAIELLANIAKWRGDQALADLLITPLGKSRIRAIHHLAGGNHRIYIIFSQFLTTASLDSLVEPFMKTLDDLTPFYQSRMQFISPQQRKIIEYLCEQRGAIPVKEIAQYCFISQQTTSSQLKQLREMGYVYADAQGRESFYELQEPLMRICLEAKKRRGTPNQLFISFLRVWFSREELEKRLEILPLEAIFDRECTLQALAEMEVSDDPKIAALLRDWNDAWENSKYEKMLEISEELVIIRGSANDWIQRANVFGLLNKSETALKLLDKAVEIEPNNALAWQAKGFFCDEIGLFEKALIFYNKSLSLDSSESRTWILKSITEAKLNQTRESLNSIKESLKIQNEQDIDKDLITTILQYIGVSSIVHGHSCSILTSISQINNPDNWKRISFIVLKIYTKYNLLEALSNSLVESIEIIYKPSTSDHAAQAWLEMWQDLAGHYPEFQVALNLLRVAVEYKIQKDKRVLFQLPKEERQILGELLNPNVT